MKTLLNNPCESIIIPGINIWHTTQRHIKRRILYNLFAFYPIHLIYHIGNLLTN